MNDPMLTCQDEQRREAVRTEHLNGLDYLEVSDDQHTLTVYFLDKAPEKIEKENVRIEGGRRIRDLEVVDLQVHREDDANLDDRMEVVVDRPGDFSTYTLRVVEPNGGPSTDVRMSGFDPRYAQLEFGFKVGCPSDLDCKPQPNGAPVERVEPEINYLAKDYASFRQLILDRLALIMPDWRERHVPDLGVALVEILAYVGDHLSYYQDAVATEAYLETARQRISVRRHARLVDYRMHEGCNARAWVCVETDVDLPLDPDDVAFIAGYDDSASNSRVLTPEDLRNAPSSHYTVFEPLAEERILFRPGDLKDPAGLADKLRRPPDHLSLLSRYLREQFSKETQQLLEDYNDSNRLPQSLPGALITDLNGVIQNTNLYNERFAQAQLAEETDRLIEQDSPQDRDLARLNRLCLEAAYPDEIVKCSNIQLYKAHKEILFHTWGDEDCYLPRGATTATLRDEWVREPGDEPPQGEPHPQSAQQSRYQQPKEEQQPTSDRHERRRSLCLQEGDVLIFEEVIGPGTGNPADADRTHRHAVRLTRVEPDEDPLSEQRMTGAEEELPTPVVEIEWAPEDALSFPLCLSIIGPECTLLENVSVARGNVILADHGETIKSENLGTVPAEEEIIRCEDECHPAETVLRPGKFRPCLEKAPLTFSQKMPACGPASGLLKQDLREAMPQIKDLLGTRAAPDGVAETRWTARLDLLDSRKDDRHFVAEIDDEGRAHLRAGDDDLGQMPEAGTGFRATYRVGNGQSGNVGAEAITRIVFRGNSAGDTRLRPRNPLPAQGGTSPESLAEAKLFAPHAFRTELHRAITADDYARLAERHPKVQRAAATLRWTGSWYEALVAVDPSGDAVTDDRLLEEIEEHLYPYRRIGHDLVVARARYVPLDVELEVCVRPDFLRGHVKADLLDLLGNRALSGGRRGYFHPDNLTFADSIFLSHLVAAAQAVPGVESVAVTKLERLFEGPNREIENGVLPLDPLEIARLDNDPNLPENGISPAGDERWSMNETFAAAAGLQPLTPLVAANRPGLNTLAYRAGTHATFLETMKARLSSSPALAGLTTREATDPAIALLDAWATIADVLSFYQERVANEGYLRTATERRSIMELARLVGYVPRPGVAASVYLAFTLEDSYSIEVPAGTRAQSLPGSGELPQSFETAEKLEARAAWNDLKPRVTRPQHLHPGNAYKIDTLYFEGISTNLRPNDPLLIVFGDEEDDQFLRWVDSVEPRAAENRTEVTLQNVPATAFVGAVRRTVNLYLDVRKFQIAPGGIMAGEVLDTLHELQTAAEPNALPEDLLGLVQQELPLLRKAHATAVKEDWSRLQPWLGGLVAELEWAVNTLPVDSVDAAPRSVASPDAKESSPGSNGTPPASVTSLAGLLAPLSKPPALQPANASRLERSLEQAFAANADAVPRLLTALDPALRPVLYAAWKNATTTPPSPVRVYALRLKASLFGHNAPRKPLTFNSRTGEITETGDWPIVEDVGTEPTIRIVHEEEDAVHLDAGYDQILPESWLVVKTPDAKRRTQERTREEGLTEERTLIARAGEPNAAISRSKYGLTGKTTRIRLAKPSDTSASVPWITADLDTISPPYPENPSFAEDDFKAIRGTSVHAQSEELALAEEPITDPVCGARIELGGLYDGLESGRWLAVSGERTDIEDSTGAIIEGVQASELVMLAGVAQGVHEIGVGDGEREDLPGDKTHSTLLLANEGLSYCYKPDTLTIYGNVAKATHGETRSEVLGSGDASKALQQFSLKQSPLTHVAATTPSGAESTLEVYVNDVRWHEAKSVAGPQPTDRRFITRTDDRDEVTAVFGDGERLPTGVENVKAVYRTGIGKAGNVEAEQISQLATRPLGLRGVINPRPATGGADRETRDQARRNAPLAVMALDRLVSVQDYEDFARTFAGIGKASATRLSDGRRQLVHLTIAGADDVPIAEDSDLYRNLGQALRQFGDPHQPIQVDVRELILLIISARVRVEPDYRWESVEPKIRAALLDDLSFERRELGQDVLLSEVIGAMQRRPRRGLRRRGYARRDSGEDYR